MKKLIARITGWPLVLCPYGFESYLRFMQKDGDGRTYVVICGQVIRHRESYHIWTLVLNCTSEDFK